METLFLHYVYVFVYISIFIKILKKYNKKKIFFYYNIYIIMFSYLYKIYLNISGLSVIQNILKIIFEIINKNKEDNVLNDSLIPISYDSNEGYYLS